MDVYIIEHRTFIIFLYKLTKLEQLTWKFNIYEEFTEIIFDIAVNEFAIYFEMAVD